MFKEEELKDIGKFQRTHALRGELNAVLDVEPEYVADGNPLMVEIDGCMIPFYAESLRPKGATSYLVKLEGVDSVEEASKFVNKPIKGLVDKLREYMDDDVFYLEDFRGFTISDTNAGRLGVVTDVDESTMNPLFYVETPEGEELIIPAADDFIDEFDEEKKTLTVTLPPGILEIN